MKKAFLVILLFGGMTMTFAQVEKQEDRQENNLDKIEQEPQQPSQIAVERASRVEAKRIRAEKRAERRARKAARIRAREEAKQQSIQ